MNAAATTTTTPTHADAAPGGELTALPPGMTLLWGGNRLARVPDEIVAAFRPGDRLVVVQTDGTVLHIPAAQHALVAEAVERARAAFVALRSVRDEQIDHFYDTFSARLADRSEEHTSELQSRQYLVCR